MRYPIIFGAWLGLFLLSSAACVSPSQFAIRQVAPVMMENSQVLQKEKSWEFFKSSAPGGLQLAEILLAEDPKNLELLALLTKGFASYAFVVNDTQALPLRLSGQESGAPFVQAVTNLEKALRYGMTYLEESGLSFEELNAAVRENRVKEILQSRFDLSNPRDRDALIFTGVSWLLTINYRTSDMTLVSQVAHAYSLIAAVCENDPDFQNGICPTLEGIYYLSRPRMMGGNPEKGRDILLSAMERYPANALVGVTYIEWFLIPAGERNGYDKLRAKLRAQLNKWRQKTFVPGDKPRPSNEDLFNIFNAMADKRLTEIEALSQDLF